MMTLPTWTHVDGEWHEGPVSLMTAVTNAAWLGNTVFDGARRFEGVMPDLDRHCARAVRSAQKLGMEPLITADAIEALVHDGIGRFDAGDALYIRPMFWIEEGFGPVMPCQARFALVIQTMPMPDPELGFTACLSRYRKPLPDTAPTEAKATCLYPQATMAWSDAKFRGFDNAVMLDAGGHVAEFTMQNLLMVKDGKVHTPAPNGMLLDGITRQRALALLRELGVEFVERQIRPEELRDADEMISTGNHARIQACRRFEDHDMEFGPVYRCLREAYWDFAHAKT